LLATTREEDMRKSTLTMLVLGAAMAASAANAATQGTAGTTSTGTVTISATIAPRVDISSLADVTFADSDLGPVVNTSNQATKASNVCVWSNNADKSYYITASGSGTSSAFSLANSTNPVVPYQVYWNATSGQTTGSQLTTATKSAKFISTATSPACGGGTSATLVIGIQGSDANAMLASTTYTGTLTLLVTPS
jgi:spore coat protein U-like protein